MAPATKDAAVAVDVAYEPLADSTNTAAEQQAAPCWQDTAASLLWLLASLQLLGFTMCLLPGLTVTLAKAICGAAGLAAACGVLASVLDLCLGAASDHDVYLLALRDLAVLLAAGASLAGAAWLGWLDYTGAVGAGSSSPALQDTVFTLAMGCVLHGLLSYHVL